MPLTRRLPRLPRAGRLAPGPAALSAALREHAQLLPAVHSLCAAVAREGLRGGPLLCRLAERVQCTGGCAPLAAAYARLAWHAHAQALRMLTAWMAFGELADPGLEFFVRRTTAEGAGGAEGDDDDGGAAEWHGAFGLVLAQLPPWLELGSAEAALFTGRAVRVLSQPRGALSGDLQRQLLPPEAVEAAAAALAALGCAPRLERWAVDSCVQKLRADAAGRLWTLMVQHAQLPSHLGALRDYFLLGRGDFFEVFLEDARPLLALPPRPSGAAAAAAQPFAAAAAKCTAAEDPLFSRLRLRFTPPPPAPAPESADAAAAAHLPSLDGWDPLTLGYVREWPLGLLLTPQALDTYGSLFQYLFRLKRAQAALAVCWAPLRRRCGGGAAVTACLALRHRFDALLGAWAHYCQVDCIAPAFAALTQRVACARDWGEASRAHAAFLAQLQGRLFLDSRPLARQLEALFQLALALAALARGAEEAAEAGAAPGQQLLPLHRVQELDAHWRRQALALVATLRGPKMAGAAGRAPALRLFLARLEESGLVPNAAALLAAPPTPGATPTLTTPR